MALQPDGTRRFCEASKTPRVQTSPTFEQLLHGDASIWPSSNSPTLGKYHDQEEDHNHHNRKSVLTKVKERAKKLRHSLSNKKKHGHELHDDNTTPPWGVSLEDEEDDDDDPEYLGAPMYESELAPEKYKETARQHPREVIVDSEKHVLASSIKHEEEQLPIPNKTITETVSEKLAPAYTAVSEKLAPAYAAVSGNVSEKLAPAYAAVSDATYTIASKIAGLTVATPAATETRDYDGLSVRTHGAEDTGKYGGSGMEKLGRSTETREHSSSSPQTWDKGVSVKEYLMQKLEPGEDERALSQVISEAMSPRKTPGDIGVVEKVKEAMTSFLQTDQEPSHSTTKTTNSTSNITIPTNNANSTSRIPISTNIATSSSHIPISTTNTNSLSHISRIPISTAAENSSSSIPISTNAHEVVEEENYGRILQAN